MTVVIARSRACIAPPNPMAGIISVPSACASGCDGNDDCPSGYRCDLVQNQFGGFVEACTPDVQDVIACPGTATVAAILATVALCQDVCPAGDRVACYEPVDGLNQGYCSCKCNVSDDCPTGFSCAKNFADTGDLALPGVCTPIAGYRCQGDDSSCLAGTCLSEPDWPASDYCSTECVQDLDCPSDYVCRLSNLDNTTYCEPEMNE